MVELFANNGDPDQMPISIPKSDLQILSGSALFANYPFRGLPTTMG